MYVCVYLSVCVSVSVFVYVSVCVSVYTSATLLLGSHAFQYCSQVQKFTYCQLT